MLSSLVPPLLVLLATVHAQFSQCSYNSRGKVKGDVEPMELPDRLIPSWVKVAEIEIPKTINRKPICPDGGLHVGTKIKACDDDGAPRVWLTTLASATVKRKTSYRRLYVSITAFCRV